MANILLPQQEFKVSDLNGQFPPPTSHKSRKIFFQCELREVHKNGDVEFGLVAYPAYRRQNNYRIPWKLVPKKVIGKTVQGGPVVTYPIDSGGTDPHVAFGNNEIPWSVMRSKDSKISEEEDPSHNINEEFFIELSNILGDKDLLYKSSVKCSARISKNPHVEYSITLDSGTTDATNPCPPYPPGE